MADHQRHKAPLFKSRPVLLVPPTATATTPTTSKSNFQNSGQISQIPLSGTRKRQTLLTFPQCDVRFSTNQGNVDRCSDCMFSTTKLRLNIHGDFVCGSCGSKQDSKHHSKPLLSQPLLKPQPLFGSPMNIPQRSHPLIPAFNGPACSLNKVDQISYKETVSTNARGKTEDKSAEALTALLSAHERICENIKSLSKTDSESDCFKFVCGFFCNLCEKIVDDKAVHRKSDEHLQSLKTNSANSTTAVETPFSEVDGNFEEITFVEDESDGDMARNSKVNPCKSADAKSSTISNSIDLNDTEREERYDRTKPSKRSF